MLFIFQVTSLGRSPAKILNMNIYFKCKFKRISYTPYAHPRLWQKFHQLQCCGMKGENVTTDWRDKICT